MFADVLRRAVRLIWPRDTVKRLALALGVSPRTAEDWLARPRSQPYRSTAAALAGWQRQAHLAGIFLEEMERVEAACERARTELILFEDECASAIKRIESEMKQ